MSNGNGGPAPRTYSPVPFAVLPGSAARGWFVGLLYVPLSIMLFGSFRSGFEGTAVGDLLSSFESAVGWAGIAGLGLMGAVSFTLFLAWLGYRRREYEIAPDGVTERRGILLRSERTLGYDEFEGVTVTESLVQSLYAAGTVRLIDVNEAEDQQVVMKMSYVRNPEDVTTTILRHLADVTGAGAGELDARDVPELDVDSASISRLSGDALAAGTGFRYLMPTAILHPRAGMAAAHGSAVGLTYSAIGGAILFYFRDLVSDLAGVSSGLVLVGSVVAGTVAFSGLLAGYFYWRYDRRQYELYEDHVTVIRGEETTRLSIGDVVDVELDESAVPLRRGGWTVLPWTAGGHIVLRDGAGDELVTFEFIASSAAVHEALENWLPTDGANAADTDDRQAASGGTPSR
jgi:uncharacterized membrane protein YdbT with pleckstrin-like domain